MSVVKIKVKDEDVFLEVGDDVEVFLKLFNTIYTELSNNNATVEVIVDRMSHNTGSDRAFVAAFVEPIKSMLNGVKPSEAWGIWAGKFASKIVEQISLIAIKKWGIRALIGLSGIVILIVIYATIGQERGWGSWMIVLYLPFSLLLLWSILPICLSFSDWFKRRHVVWPQLPSTSISTNEQIPLKSNLINNTRMLQLSVTGIIVAFFAIAQFMPSLIPLKGLLLILFWLGQTLCAFLLAINKHRSGLLWAFLALITLTLAPVVLIFLKNRLPEKNGSH
jgi:hypothetical protein